jgi:hypothetical protein
MSPVNPSLLVPMNLAALCVGQPDRQMGPNEGSGFGKIAVDFQMLPSLNEAYLSKSIVSDPFEGETRPMPGIHLHWALPDALTRSQIDSRNGTVTRPAPNRFLVVRLRAGAPSLEAWVVESDYLWSNNRKDTVARERDPRNALSRAVPLKPEFGKPTFAYQGRVFPWATWEEKHPNPSPDQHTALGYGTETYAAAYPNCRNVFGFFDPLVEAAPDGLAMEKQSLSYLVIGWHSDATCDPIRRESDRIDPQKKGVAPESLAAALQANYHWSYRAELGKPERTLYVGQLIELDYDPGTGYLTPAKETAPVEIALGATTTEALSALIANMLVNKLKREKSGTGGVELERLATISETLLNDLQGGLLSELNKLGTATCLAKLQDELHRRDFAVYSAGHASEESESGVIWSVELDNTEISPETKTAETVAQPLPGGVARNLNNLNLVQARYDEIAAAVATRRAQVFADWSQYINLVPRGNQPERLSRTFVDAARNYIKAEIEALGWDWDGKVVDCSLFKDLQSALEELKTASRWLKESLLKHNHEKLKNKLKVESAAAPRFYQPNDPVILLSGQDAKPSDRYGGDGSHDPDKKGNLICRLSGEITTTMQGQGGIIGEHHPPELSANTLLGADFATLKDHFKWLAAEAVLLDPGQARLLAALLVPGISYDNVPDGILASIKTDQEAFRDRKQTQVFTFGSSASAPPSKVGLTQYTKPWIPLILQWEATLSPHRPARQPQDGPSPQDWVLREFSLDGNDVDINYRRQPPSNSSPATYQGTVTLTHYAERNLKEYIDDYLEAHPPDSKDDPATRKMKEILQEIKDLRFSMMTQAMGGFHRQLLMRNPILQLPVFHPGADHTDAKFEELVKKAVDRERDAAVLPINDFNPLRAGILKLTRLRVLDAFGQARDIIGEDRQLDVILANRLKAPKEWKEAGALLPLRITQPAQLSFRFQSASSLDSLEMSSDPASSPVFGWVLYNRLDHTLAIYDEVGSAVGSFNIYGAPWQQAPGPHRGAANPHLRQFLKYLGSGELNFKTFLEDLMKTIDYAAIEPDAHKQDQGLAVLIGRPLALVRAGLRLDLYGALRDRSGALPDRSLPNGLPAIDQSLPAFKAAVDSFRPDGPYEENSRGSADFAQCRFPVRLGDFERANDGLVGYFIEGENQSDTYRTLYACTDAGNRSRSIVDPHKGSPPLWLCPADKDPKAVIMLVDPRAPVHAITGILPVKSISLPPAHFADAMKRIAVTFLTAPVLSPADGPALAVPAEVGHAWSWLTREVDGDHDGVRKWMTKNIVESPNTSAAFSAPPLRFSEGWLHLYPAKTSSTAPDPNDILVLPDEFGLVKLSAQTARLHGSRITVAETDDGNRFIGYWNDETESVSWKVKFQESGVYKVAVKYSTKHPVSQIMIEVRNSKGEVVRQKDGAASVSFTCPGAGDWSKPKYLIHELSIGDSLDPDGYEIAVRPKGEWMAINVWWVWMQKSGAPIVLSDSIGDVRLFAEDARQQVTKIRTPKATVGPYSNFTVMNWNHREQYATWLVGLLAPAQRHNALIYYGAPDESRIVIEVRDPNGETVRYSCTLPGTGRPNPPGAIMIAALSVPIALGPPGEDVIPGEYVIKIRPDNNTPWKGIALFNIDLKTRESVPPGWKLESATGLYKP